MNWINLTNFACFAVGFLLLALVAVICVREWLREKSEAWYEWHPTHRDGGRRWSVPRPWYVRLHEWF